MSDDHGRNWGVTPSRTATSEIPDDISQIYSLEMFLYIPLILLSSKVILKVLSTVRSGEPAGTRTQDPRLKRATQAITTEDERVRLIDTNPLKSYNISFLPL